jgi:hypothetical protein
MPTRYYLPAIWLIFLAEGAFYCNLIPLWEGFDEWGHYAFIEHLRLHPGVLPRTTDQTTEEIRHSVQSAPIRHEAQDPMFVFEAQQPPLYYWILSVPNRLWIGADIATRVHRLRLVSIFIASLAIPLAWLAAIELFHSRRMAFSVCALITAMPCLMIDISRIGNESLAVAVAAWIVLLLLRKNAPALGLALGLGLLTKAYFLAFIPLLILRRFLPGCMLTHGGSMEPQPSESGQARKLRFRNDWGSLLVAIGIGGWWYLRNFYLTRTWTGEIMDVQATKMGWTMKLAAIGKVQWLKVLDVALWTHIWTGAWSFFTLKTWMYRVFELIFAIAALMLVAALLRSPWGRAKRKLATLVAVELLFALGIAYQALSIFMSKNISFGPGWYFYALAAAEALLLASSMLILAGRRHVLLAMGILISLFAAMNIYAAVFILGRYYR